MSRSFSLAACLVTIAVVVPVAWHRSDATIAADGPAVRPLRQAFTTHGVRVTVDVDRSVITTGDAVTATLHAYADAPRSVALDLTVLESRDEPGERVAPPPRAIEHEQVTLAAAADGGKGVTRRLVLGEHTRHAARTSRFMVYIAPHGHAPPTPDDDGPDYSGQITKGVAAGFGVLAWSGDSLHLAITPEGPITGDAPFTIDLRVTNTSGRTLPEQPVFELGTELGLEGTVLDGEDFEIEPIAADGSADGSDDDGDDDGDVPTSFAKGAVAVQKYRVTPHHKGLDHVTFVAGAYAWPDEAGPILAGAMDIATFPIGAQVAAK